MEETGWLQEILDDVKVEIVHWPPWMRYVSMEHDEIRTSPPNPPRIHSTTD